MLDNIRLSIASHGYHVTLVQGRETPRFAYTVGLSDAGGHELVLAGAASLSADEVKQALDTAAEAMRGGSPSLTVGAALDVDGAGSFELGSVDPSWPDELLLGALDFYGRDEVAAMQLIPLGEARTVDVPDLSEPWDPARQPVWRWLSELWSFEVSPESVAVTDLGALRGQPISEAARWEESEWEMFAGSGPDVAREDVRMVPLATLLGFDASLEPVTRLDVGHAIRRSPPGPWEPWGE